MGRAIRARKRAPPRDVVTILPPDGEGVVQIAALRTITAATISSAIVFCMR
jgi:hypothetical protein